MKSSPSIVDCIKMIKSKNVLPHPSQQHVAPINESDRSKKCLGVEFIVMETWQISQPFETMSITGHHF